MKYRFLLMLLTLLLIVAACGKKNLHPRLLMQTSKFTALS